jgi:hypothetical protein
MQNVSLVYCDYCQKEIHLWGHHHRGRKSPNGLLLDEKRMGTLD